MVQCRMWPAIRCQRRRTLHTSVVIQISARPLCSEVQRICVMYRLLCVDLTTKFCEDPIDPFVHLERNEAWPILKPTQQVL
eukprot:CAMPEP_0169153250 /NCGR_PEP_ID=MMETSP1015-20121227/52009_1 /TAXON_ID=342587 /ORGANISM="Karlodinium micrum, Strain CCMP2283" /LENGTH=80 /DNA_ID=CAMNT_0009223223 /DNA_START=556 /DNA_END=798 /DNA_ORIENTATION=-